MVGGVWVEPGSRSAMISHRFPAPAVHPWQLPIGRQGPTAGCRGALSTNAANYPSSAVSGSHLKHAIWLRSGSCLSSISSFRGAGSCCVASRQNLDVEDVLGCALWSVQTTFFRKWSPYNGWL